MEPLITYIGMNQSCVRALKLAIESYDKLGSSEYVTTDEILERARMFDDFMQQQRLAITMPTKPEQPD